MTLIAIMVDKREIYRVHGTFGAEHNSWLSSGCLKAFQWETSADIKSFRLMLTSEILAWETMESLV